MTSNDKSQKNMHFSLPGTSQSYRFSNVHIADTFFLQISVLFKTLVVVSNRILT